MFFQKYSFAIIIASFILITGCGKPQKNDRLTIVTTTGIIGDCLQNITPDDVEVISLMGAGVDPHLYKASQGDIDKLIRADIIIYNGLHLEGKMAKMLENYAKQKPTFAVGNYVDKSVLKKVDETSNLVDPHIWFSPDIWRQGIKGVANELSKIEGLERTMDKFDIFEKKIAKTQSELRTLLDSTLDKDKRILITSHDAFNYFGDAFDFQVRGLQGISTAAEYGAKDVKDLTDFIIDQNIKSVFIETSVSNKNLEAVIEGAQARGYTLKIGGTLYSDALGQEGTASGNYIGMLQSNVHTIIKGLQ